MINVSGVLLVDGVHFADWFNANIAKKGDFQHYIIKDNFTHVFENISKMTGQSELTYNQFIALCLMIYNETGGQFKSMSEHGGSSYIESAGNGKVSYSYKERGRGLIQLTWAPSYRIVLSQLGYNYDALSASQLDALFLNPDIYFASVRIYFTHPQLAVSAWQAATNGDFRTFGTRVSGGSACGQRLAGRASVLQQSLQGKRLTIAWHNSTKQMIKISLAFLVAIVGLVFVFRKEILLAYKKGFQKAQNTLIKK